MARWSRSSPRSAARAPTWWCSACKSTVTWSPWLTAPATACPRWRAPPHHLRLVTRPEIPRRKREIVPRRRRDVGQQIEMRSDQRPRGFRAVLRHFTAEIVYLKHRFRDRDGGLIEPALRG